MTRAAEDPNPLPAPNQSPPSDAAPAPAVPAAASGRVRGLHPGWFASVMGTAIVAVATYGNPGNLTVLEGAAHAVGVVLAVVAYALGVVLVVAYAARWVRHTGAALADLRNPVLGGLHATLPGGLLVLAVMTSVVGPDLLPEQVATVLIATLAAIGGVLALVIGVAFGYTLFTGDPPAQSVNGSWFIPPVVTIIVPMVLAPLIPHTDPTTARLLLFLGWAGFGMGFLLFLFVMGLFHDRLVLHPLPPSPLAPSLWIGLGPVGVAVLAPITLARAGQDITGPAGPTVTAISQLFGTAMWGFGLWWLAIAVALLVRYRRAGALPFNMGWWAFTFPLGAYTVATVTLARIWQVPALEALAGMLYLALVAFWAVVSVRTVRAVRTGAIWRR